jgi:hypothetical protein
MTEPTVAQRLAYDPDADLAKLLAAFGDGEITLAHTGLNPHFHVLRRARGAGDHPPVLAVSIGGSNTKVMLAEFAGGRARVHKAVARPNPDAPTAFVDYLDELLARDPVFGEYLRNHPQPRIGVSLAVSIIDGVPFHLTKIPTLTGLTARDLDRDGPTHHFGRNLRAWLDARGMGHARLVYQGDGIIAHLGGVAMDPPDEGDKSMLIVCGSGLATADDDRFILCATYALTQGEDPLLHPHEQTEDGQYQYLIAGKGLHGVMRRAIELRQREPDTALRDFDPSTHFGGPAQSRNVADVWIASLPSGEVSDRAASIREALGPAGWSELTDLAARIMGRGVSVLANCTLATLVHMGPSASGSPARVFCEGSIALNPHINARLKQEVADRAGDRAVYRQAGVSAPRAPEFAGDVRKIDPASGSHAKAGMIDEVDLTLIGAAAMAVAQDRLGWDETD